MKAVNPCHISGLFLNNPLSIRHRERLKGTWRSRLLDLPFQSVTCFLTIYQVTQDKTDDERINKARIKGFDFITQWQRDSGLWKDDTFHPAGIETTAHLMQYTLVPAYFMDKIECCGQNR